MTDLTVTKLSDAAYQEILTKAYDAASAACVAEEQREPEDMNAFDCGFAWVDISDGRHPFVNFCRKQIKKLGPEESRRGRHNFGDKHWRKGWSFWSPGRFRGQSVRIHRVGADAFAKVLKEHDIPAVAYDRLD